MSPGEVNGSFTASARPGVLPGGRHLATRDPAIGFRNIDGFGGDRARVTIAGQSAGGHSVCALLASSATQGMLNGAIIQSGGCPGHTVAVSQAVGERFANDTGCGATPDPLACLRSRPAVRILASSAGLRGGILSGPLPTAGVPELPIAPMTAVETGRFARVPLLIGSTQDEARGWAQPFAKATPAQYEKSLEYLFGNRAMLLQPAALRPLEQLRLPVARPRPRPARPAARGGPPVAHDGFPAHPAVSAGTRREAVVGAPVPRR
jgi:hypothetical protein